MMYRDVSNVFYHGAIKQIINQEYRLLKEKHNRTNYAQAQYLD